MSKAFQRIVVLTALLFAFMAVQIASVHAADSELPFTISYNDEAATVSKLSGIDSITVDGVTHKFNSVYQLDYTAKTKYEYLYDGFFNLTAKDSVGLGTYVFSEDEDTEPQLENQYVDGGDTDSLSLISYDGLVINGYSRDDEKYLYNVLFSLTYNVDEGKSEIDGNYCVILRVEKDVEAIEFNKNKVCGLKIGGKDVLLDEDADNPVVSPDLPAGVSFDYYNRTLTLDNCTIDYDNTPTEENYDTSYISYYDGSLNIVLKGNNVLKGAKQEYWTGINAGSKLKISGSGSLTIDMTQCNGGTGIYSMHGIDIEDCKLIIKGGNKGKMQNSFYGMSLVAWENYGINEYGEGDSTEIITEDYHIGIKNATVDISNKFINNTEKEPGYNIGIDSQDSNLKIENSTVNITMDGAITWGIGTGLYGERTGKYYGGKLSIDEKSHVTIKLLNPTDYINENDDLDLYALYYFTDDIKSPSIYVDDEKGAAVKTDKKAIQKHTWVNVRSECTNQFLEFAPAEQTHDAVVIPPESKLKPNQSGSGSGSEDTPTPSDGGSGSNVTPTPSDGSGNTALREVKIKHLYNNIAYDGRHHKNNVIVTDAKTGLPLSEGMHYKLKWVLCDGKNIGRQVYIIEYIGNYKGLTPDTGSFNIIPAKSWIRLAKAGKKKVKLTLGRVKGRVKYLVAYKYKGKWKYKTSNKVNLVLKKLKSKKTYKIKVRAFKKVKGRKFYSKWSKVKKVKIK